MRLEVIENSEEPINCLPRIVIVTRGSPRLSFKEGHPPARVIAMGISGAIAGVADRK